MTEYGGGTTLHEQLLEIRDLTLKGGYGKDGEKEPVNEVNLRMGDIVSIVGPTGSGKTELINDIERFASGNTPSKRRVLVNGIELHEDFVSEPSKNPVALITQHTNFLSDFPVRRFLEMHAKVRQSNKSNTIVDDTLNFANELTGEPVIPDSAMTELSGGQTRALLIADAVVIGSSPIILLDEIENAGIDRTRALELLKQYEKVFIFVTHDPRIALLSDLRIIMKNGAMQKKIIRGDSEKRAMEEIEKIDELLTDLRGRVRNGDNLSEDYMISKLKALGYIA
jgi:ABC-type lipoprotein export system ATPase subunit